MIQLGRKQKLQVVKKWISVSIWEKNGCRRSQPGTSPGKAGAGGNQRRRFLQVFLYKDSSDRMIATTREPAFQVGRQRS